MTQIQDDHRFLDSQLYVQRTIRPFRGDGQVSQAPGVAPIHSEELTRPHVRGRAVIIGNPGVGKSTLIGHMALQLSSDIELGLTPIVLLCKKIGAPSGEDVSIVEHVVRRLSADHSLTLNVNQIRDLLLLGKACLIFDGIDEVLDHTRRRTLIRRIEAFAEEFPAVSVLATSRKVGYEQARFSDDFQTYSLAEFDYRQFLEYVRRWFALTRRDDVERNAFIAESESVADIRSNPLMLSLLCGLYQARGYIPRNRRLVYRECADLLFTRWDASRQIEQPTDHRQHGNYLMHEIALFFFENQTAQAGVEESQLTGLIARFFENTAGLDRDESTRRARLFLEFCSGRAWLLSRLGTDARGRRLYSFTHRTFMEYYAAEAFVRRSDGIEHLVDRIEKVFRSNPSSVVPEVMVQAFDERVERGAEKVLRLLVARGTRGRTGVVADNYLTLCLRTVNVCAMSRAIIDLLPQMCLDFWREAGPVKTTNRSSAALFELHRDARAKMLDGRDHAKSGRLEYEIDRRWARFELIGSADQFDAGWADEVRPLLYANEGGNSRFQEVPWMRYVATHGLSIDQAIVDLWLLRHVVSPGELIVDAPNVRRAEPSLLTEGFGGVLPGVALRVIVSIIDGEWRLIDDWHRGLLRYYWRRTKVHVSHVIADEVLKVLYSEHVGWSLDWGSPAIGFAEVVEEAKPIFLWLALLDFEVSGSLAGMSEAVISELIGISKFWQAVNRNVAIDPDCSSSFGSYGNWARAWVHGQRIING
ncbi:NACHT domain-containing protein [Pseudonocardia endophytica]|nr:NACHT domain-containing protein [Pseudonocardia endophytica]